MKTKMYISCMLALMLTAAAWAQVAPSSPQKDATAGLTSTEVDQFMSTTDWGNVKFDKAFTYVGYAQTRYAHSRYNWADLGAAFKAGPVYIGAWYQGNLGMFSGKRDQSVGTAIAQDSITGVLGNTKRSTETGVMRSYDADHTAAMLIGFGNMGFQFGYKRTGKNESGKYYNRATAKDSTETNTSLGGLSTGTDTIYSPKGFVNTAKHTPFVAFGMNIPLGAMTLSPTAALEVSVQQNSNYGLKTETTKTNNISYKTVKTAQSENASYTGVTGKLGAGLALGDSLHSYINIGYDFTVNAYGKTYTDAAGNKHKVRGTYKVLTDTVEDDYNKTTTGVHKTTKTFKAEMTTKGYFSNTLTPSYSMQKDFNDRLSLFAGLECPITITAEKDVVTTEDKTVTVTKNLNPSKSYLDTTKTVVTTAPVKTVNTTTVEVAPKAMAAISYAAVPNRLSLSLGTSVSFLKGKYTYKKTAYNKFVTTTETTTEYANGTPTLKKPTVTSANRSESVEKNGSHDPVNVELKGGLKWNIAENFVFDVVYTQSLLDTVQVFQLGNLKLACTIKF